MNAVGLADISIADEGKVEVEEVSTAEKEAGANSPDSAHDLAPTTPNRTTDSDKAADLAFNQAVVHALASQLATAQPQHSLAQVQQLILAADSFPHACHLLLLALVQACHLSGNPAGVAAAILKVVRANWLAVEGSGAVSKAVTVAAADDKGRPTAAHFRHWERKTAKSHATVLQQAFLAALRHASAQELQEVPSQLVCTYLPAVSVPLARLCQLHAPACSLSVSKSHLSVTSVSSSCMLLLILSCCC